MLELALYFQGKTKKKQKNKNKTKKYEKGKKKKRKEITDFRPLQLSSAVNEFVCRVGVTLAGNSVINSVDRCVMH